MKSVLLIDDNIIQLRSLKVMLQGRYEVYMASSYKDAEIILKIKKPDLIFLDYEMPECNGKESLEKIRQMDDMTDVPVVFLTGVKDKEHIQAVLKLKPDGYLLKPAEADKIIETAERLIGK